MRIYGLKNEAEEKKKRKPQKNEESKIQRACIKWFDYQYRKYDKLLFSVPNGGRRDIITASIMKGEGVRTGVADLILLVPNGLVHGLCIEMKTDKGKQSDEQKEFEKQVIAQGYSYKICRSLEEFMKVINEYLA